MGNIHLSEAQQKEMRDEEVKRQQAFDKKVVALMVEEGYAIIPRMNVTPGGIVPFLAYERIPEEKLEEFKKRAGL